MNSLTGKYSKKPRTIVCNQKIVIACVCMGLAFLGGYMTTERIYEALRLHTPLSSNYSAPFVDEVQAEETKLTPMPSATLTPTPTVIPSPTESAPPVQNTAEQVQESVSEVEQLIRDTFGDAADEAVKVATCESHMRPEAIGDKHITFIEDGREMGYSVGVFQIRMLRGRPDEAYLLDARNNINYAHGMYQAQGWNPWTCKYVLEGVNQ